MFLMCVCACVYTHAHTHIYTYIYIYIYIIHKRAHLCNAQLHTHKRALLLCNATCHRPRRSALTLRGAAAWGPHGAAPPRSAGSPRAPPGLSSNTIALFQQHQPQVSDQLPRSHCLKAGAGRAGIRKHDCVRARVHARVRAAARRLICTH